MLMDLLRLVLRQLPADCRQRRHYVLSCAAHVLYTADGAQGRMCRIPALNNRRYLQFCRHETDQLPAIQSGVPVKC